MDAESAVTTCYRHPRVESYVSCTRCERFICPDCMREAAVGHQCPECVKEGARSVRRARTVFGGTVTAAPVVTYALIALNVLVYLAELARPELVDRFAMLGSGLIGPDGLHYLPESGDVPAGFQAEGVAAGQWERLITSGFLHLMPTEGTFGIAHVVLNMLALWRLGQMVEPQLGRGRFLALYLLSTLGGSVLELLLADPGQLSLGASGGLFGLTVAAYVMARRLGSDLTEVHRMMVLLLLWLVVSAQLTSWQGHLGGLLAGGAVAAAFAYAPRGPRRTAIQAAACAVILVALLVAAWARVTELTGGAA
ncbi:membrane associated rhomboid family serine protease [Streptomyces sp. SAI-170]|uniref:rhomboid family intramembrane serine protease n=1 Tax=Streptomyces sp. SAI-170 TaxID=3377729 RepID=UPI003C79C333